MKRSPLKRPTAAQVAAWQRRARRPIARRGRKAKREASAIARFRREVRARAAGWCEAWDLKWPSICDARQHLGDTAHHVWPEDRDRGVHEARRGVWLCAPAHRWVHEHPADAALVGLMRPGSA